MSTISTTADLLRLLREDPDFRDEVRRLLLTQELIELPERFARFEAYVERQFNEIRGDINEIRGDINEIRGDITRIDGSIARMGGEITGIRGDVGRLKGSDYERHVSRNFSSYASIAFRQRHNRRLRRNRLLHSKAQGIGVEFEELLSNAVDSGLISDEELSELGQADAVMSGQDETATVYFVGEISMTVNNSDIERAVIRASILHRATGSSALPMVIGETIPGPQEAQAERQQVEFIVIGQ